MEMIDREKVTRAVDSCFDYWLEQHRCLLPLELEAVRQLKTDALTLLKEQKPIAIKQERIDEFYGAVSCCPKCDCVWIMGDGNDMHFCPKCGQAVKWNEIV